MTPPASPPASMPAAAPASVPGVATHRPMAAALWMLGSVASFSIMAIAVRQMGNVHDTFELMAFRSVIGVALVTMGALILGRLGDIRTAKLSRHFGRNVLHFTGQNLWFYAMMTVPLAQVFALEFTSPIWVILLSPLVFGEKLTAPRLLAAAMGFAGILMVTRPDFSMINSGTLAAIGCGFFFAATALMTKSLTREESIVSILFWLTVMQLIFGFTIAGYDGDITFPTAHSAPWLVVIGITGVTAHLCLTSALSLAPASFVFPIDFIRLPLIAVVGAWAYSEAIDPWVIAGGAVIFAGNWINLAFGARAAPSPVANPR
jgi:drug/metabolite transporter (DMT)-like permease